MSSAPSSAGPTGAFEAALSDIGCTVHDTDKVALLAWLDSDECKAWEAADPLTQDAAG